MPPPFADMAQRAGGPATVVEAADVAGYAVDAVVLGSIFTLFALGLTLSWGVLNILNLAHAQVFMFGALSAYLITQEVMLSLWALLPLAMIIGGLVSLLLELIAFRPIRRRVADARAAELSMVIASVGAGAAMVVVGQNLIDAVAVAIDPAVFEVKRISPLGISMTNIELLIVVLALVLSVGLALFVKHSRHGVALKALAHDPYTCGLLGISSDRLASATMFVSGALAALAGVLLAVYLGTVDPFMGESQLLKVFAAIIIGGVGSVWGAMVGAFLLAFAEVATAVYVSGSLRDMVAFALIIVLLVFRPQGLFSRGAWQRA